MERVRLRYKDSLKAVETLREILGEPFSIIVRDAAIQRFEYTFESLWKLLKEFLKEKEGVLCNAPKSCFREAFAVGIISEDDTVKCLEMTDDRNMTSHTYREEVAQVLYGKLGEYCALMELIMDRIGSSIDVDST